MRAIREFSMNRTKLRGFSSPIFALLMVGMLAAGCGELTGPTSPSTPTGVTATLLSATSAMVTWTPSPQNDGVISYSVYRNGTKVGESKTTSYTDTGLSQQLTYKYTVAANCTSGVVSDQSVVTAASTVVTVDITPPTVISHQPPTGFLGVSPGATATVTFSEPMDPATINTTTFNLKVTAGGVPIPGTVTYTPATRIAEFKPTSALPNPADITATVTTGAKDLAGNGLAAPFAWGFRTRDDTPPTVIATTPANGATGVLPSVAPTVTFSEAMDPTTINAANITLKVTSSGAAVAGSVAYNTSSHVATFTPSASLAETTGFTLTIAGAVKDSVGNAMGTAVVVTFTTRDTTAPTVVSTVPVDGATGVSPTAPITATFSEAMDPTTVNTTTFTLKTTSGQVPVAGAVTYNAATFTATFTPSASLGSTTAYTASITNGAKDLSGNSVVPKAWNFTTADVVPPTVVSVSPGNLAAGVAANTTIQVTFSEPMAPATITTANIFLKNTATSVVVPATVSYNGATKVATLTPTAPLSGGTNYTLTVTTGVKDEAGNSLASAFTSVFTTAIVDTTPPTVIAVSPVNNATNVATNTTVRVTFSEPMDPTTINTTTISLRNTSTSAVIAATVAYNPATDVATLTPTGPLSNSTNYTLTVTTGVKDIAGNAMTSPFTSSFTVVPPPDTTKPTIISRSPADGAIDVATNTVVTVTFSEPMDTTTINAANIKLADSLGTAVAGAVTYNAATNAATFTPTSALNNKAKYTLTVTTGVKDVAGNALAAQAVSTFTTIADTTKPTVVTNTPTDSVAVPITTPVTVTFSERMDPATINGTTFTVTGGAGTGAVSYDVATKTARFTPTGGSLLPTMTYTATVTTGAKDLAGNPLVGTFSFTFKTAP